MKKYNCNNALDYVHEHGRMCNIFISCSGCPLLDLNCRVVANITPEHIERVQAWSDAHPEPIILTDKQREILEALNLLGFRYIAQDSDSSVCAYTERPEKGDEMWTGNCGYFVLKSKNLRAGIFDAISSLVSWDDKEPLCIAEALEQAEEANP